MVSTEDCYMVPVPINSPWFYRNYIEMVSIEDEYMVPKSSIELSIDIVRN